jgi:hypothetical protein
VDVRFNLGLTKLPNKYIGTMSDNKFMVTIKRMLRGILNDVFSATEVLHGCVRYAKTETQLYWQRLDILF